MVDGKGIVDVEESVALQKDFAETLEVQEIRARYVVDLDGLVGDFLEEGED